MTVADSAWPELVVQPTFTESPGWYRSKVFVKSLALVTGVPPMPVITSVAARPDLCAGVFGITSSTAAPLVGGELAVDVDVLVVNVAVLPKPKRLKPVRAFTDPT